jgi:predicted nucleic acid-binding Zn ribbon protein
VEAAVGRTAGGARALCCQKPLDNPLNGVYLGCMVTSDQVQPKHCADCGKAIEPGRHGNVRRYCDSGCRFNAFVKRQAQKIVAEEGYIKPLST